MVQDTGKINRKVEDEKRFLEMYGDLGEEMGMIRYWHGSMDYAETLKLRFRVGGLDVPERRNKYTSSREKEDEDAQKCPCGEAVESRTQMLGGCEVYKEERDMLQEMRKIDVWDMEKFGTLDSSEKAISILGGRWCGHRGQGRKGTT